MELVAISKNRWNPNDKKTSCSLYFVYDNGMTILVEDGKIKIMSNTYVGEDKIDNIIEGGSFNTFVRLPKEVQQAVDFLTNNDKLDGDDLEKKFEKFTKGYIEKNEI